MRPTSRALGVAAVAATMVVLAVFSGSPGPVALAAALGVALVMSPVLAWMRARGAVLGVKVLTHVIPPMVPVGASSTLEVTVVNTARRPMAPVALELPDGAWRPVPTPTPPTTTAAATGRRTLGHLAPGTVSLFRIPALEPAGSTTAAWRVPTVRRGMFVLPPRRVWAHDPLALFGVAVAASPAVVVVVHPRAALEVALPFSPGTGTATGAPASPALPTDTGVGGELADLRPYVPGDRLHLLHWPAFARYGTLLVRRFDPESTTVLRIVVDDRAGVHRRGDFEEALSATQAIVEGAADAGIALELATFSGSHATVAPTPQGVAAVLPLLSTLQPVRASSPGSVPAWVDAGSGSPTIVTTVTGASRLPPALRRCAKVVV